MCDYCIHSYDNVMPIRPLSKFSFTFFIPYPVQNLSIKFHLPVEACSFLLVVTSGWYGNSGKVEFPYPAPAMDGRLDTD